MLDREIAAAIGRSGFGDELSAETLGDNRSLIDNWSADAQVAIPDVEVRDVHIPGSRSLRLRIFTPSRATGPLPVIYSIHGGGYVSGSYRQDDGRLSEWCDRFASLVVSVDYALAPEHPYPAALHDCRLGLDWIRENHDEVRADPNRIGLSGFSAGGGLAAALSIFLRDHAGLQGIKWQVLAYPMVNDRNVQRAEDVPVWNARSNAFAWQSYLGELFGSEDVSQYAAASRAVDLQGLPPTFLMVGSADLFYEEGVALARQLLADGVETEFHVYAGAPHGFFSLAPEAEVTRRAACALESWLSDQLRRGQTATAERAGSR
ncbi:alpha/beta hydrolase [Jatrophihabitans sp. DSM 45814]